LRLLSTEAPSLHRRYPASSVLLKSGVKFAVFVQIGPKTGICSKNLCSC
jgi:hypothetical protein